jgi:hypothetical protein
MYSVGVYRFPLNLNSNFEDDKLVFVRWLQGNCMYHFDSFMYFFVLLMTSSSAGT